MCKFYFELIFVGDCWDFIVYVEYFVFVEFEVFDNVEEGMIVDCFFKCLM